MLYNLIVIVMYNEFVNEIVRLSEISFEYNEVPVGAIVVKDNEIIGRGYNNREKNHLITGHAEIMAINEACKYLNDWRLDECDLYVTLRPCMMCTGAIVDSRIKNVYYLCDKTYVRFIFGNCNYIKIDDSEMENKYIKLLKSFFETMRNQ